ALLNDPAYSAAPARPQAAKAKNVIFLFMDGGPSQVDTFDPKPRLAREHGQPIKMKVPRTQFNNVGTVFQSPWQFKQRGQSGLWVSDLFPHIAECADDLCVIRSMVSNFSEHTNANYFIHSGSGQQGRPSLGSWMTYGLGSECRDLPGFVVFVSGESQPDGGKACWASGFLPTVYQGVAFRSQGDPVLFLTNPEGVTDKGRRESLDLLKSLNETHLASNGDPEIVTRIASYEMAYRMQSHVPEMADISQEPAAIHEMYGTEPGKKSFANNCLLARRLVER